MIKRAANSTLIGGHFERQFIQLIEILFCIGRDDFIECDVDAYQHLLEIRNIETVADFPFLRVSNKEVTKRFISPILSKIVLWHS